MFFGENAFFDVGAFGKGFTALDGFDGVEDLGADHGVAFDSTVDFAFDHRFKGGFNAVNGDDGDVFAIQAIEAAGLKPGKDITIVSIDGVKSAFEAMADGKLNCTVECNPMIGGQIFDAVEAIKSGKTLPKRIDVQEGVFTETQAKEALPTRQY